MIRLLFTVSLLFTILLFNYCSSNSIALDCKKDEKKFSIKDFHKRDSLNFQTFSNDDGFFADMILKDTVLFVRVLRKKNSIDLLSTNTGKLIKKELIIGNGPNEVVGVFGQGIVNDSIFWVYEGESNIIDFYKLKDVLNKDSLAPVYKRVMFNMDRFPFRIIPMSTDRFLVNGNPLYRSKISIINEKGQRLKDIGKYINVYEDTLIYLKGAYQYYVGKRPDNKKIVLAYGATDVLEIYDVTTGKMIIVLHGPDDYDVYPPVTHDKMKKYFTQKKGTREAYMVQVSNRYIYALYNGTSDKNKYTGGKYIFVFDWDGNLIKRFDLREKIGSFAVDEKNFRIYAVSAKTGKLIYSNFKI
jgi:hypothetical protein